MRRPPRQKQRQPELKFRRHPPHGPRCQPQPHPPATVVASVGATGIAPIGANACASWDASAIISPTPAAANRTVFLMDCHLSLSIAARREKSVFGRERQSDRAPQRSSFTIRSRPASGIASRKAPARRPRSRVSNFEQTGEAGAGNCRTDGRVAQSAERVREQHETVVRNHSPAAIPLASGRQRTQAHGRSGNEPTRPLPRLMECGGPCGPRGK